MQKLLIALMAALLMSGTASASERTDVMSVVHEFIDGLNRNDEKAALAACAPETSIIDDFAPHVWNGPQACNRWASDFDADSSAQGVTDGIVTLLAPHRVDITADRAYVVVRANYAYKLKGKPIHENGSTFTVALQKGKEGWRITAWAWSRS
jgi:hypothetical protein